MSGPASSAHKAAMSLCEALDPVGHGRPLIPPATAGTATEGDCQPPRGRRADGDAARPAGAPPPRLLNTVGAILAKIDRRHPRHSLLHELPQRRRPFLSVGAGSEVTKFAVDLEIARFHAGVVQAGRHTRRQT